MRPRTVSLWGFIKTLNPVNLATLAGHAGKTVNRITQPSRNYHKFVTMKINAYPTKKVAAESRQFHKLLTTGLDDKTHSRNATSALQK